MTDPTNTSLLDVLSPDEQPPIGFADALSVLIGGPVAIRSAVTEFGSWAVETPAVGPVVEKACLRLGVEAFCVAATTGD